MNTTKLSEIRRKIEEFEQTTRDQQQVIPRFFEISKAFLNRKKKKQVEFFFYADEETNAIELKSTLLEMKGYEVYGISPSGNQFSIIGCTPPIDLSDEFFASWVALMNELAFIHSVIFDGWGMPGDF